VWKFIEKLRGYPSKTRKTITLGFSIFLTAFIVISWMVFPVPHFGNFSVDEKERKMSKNLATPFSVIGDEIYQTAGDIKNEVSGLRDVSFFKKK
jgi:hypothetical protein